MDVSTYSPPEGPKSVEKWLMGIVISSLVDLSIGNRLERAKLFYIKTQIVKKETGKKNCDRILWVKSYGPFCSPLIKTDFLLTF